MTTTPRSLETTDDKSSLRRRARVWRDGLDPGDRAERSSALRARLAPLLRDRGPVALFASHGSEAEVDALALDPAIDASFPVTDAAARTLTFHRASGPPTARGAFGIREPVGGAAVDPADLGAVLVPGLLFARDGHRVGYGGGFYDRFLAGLPAHTLRIGVAFDEQLVDTVPNDPWDVPLTHVVTDHQTVTVASTTGPGAAA